MGASGTNTRHNHGKLYIMTTNVPAKKNSLNSNNTHTEIQPFNTERGRTPELSCLIKIDVVMKLARGEVVRESSTVRLEKKSVI